ncbi:hypothetical protein [Sphingomonas sp.]|jgi:hypothetical protein|uniref:hypothetical protein n=1 Tax=Sphingomonas sp. TaxID=28214 RepID=UPI00262D3252|nr:hypothetical protein [Sphingomonas sp.]MDF2494535.1 hypothetical protein [Sphingomonas sp.]
MMRPPLTGYEHRELLASAAVRLLTDRERSYPPLVERGRLEASAAEAGLRCGRALVAQWRWIIDRANPLLPAMDDATGGHFGAPASEIAADLARATARARDLAARRDDDRQLMLLADCYAALTWLQQGNWIVEMISGARIITAQLRASAGKGRQPA